MKIKRLYEGAISGSEKQWTYQELADMERKFDDFLKQNNATNIRFGGTFNQSRDRISDIVMEGTLQGDWKHEHWAFKELVKEFAKENNLIIVNIFSTVIDDTGSDWYTARYKIPMIEKTDSAQNNLDGLRKIFGTNESLKESYKDDQMMVYMNTWANYNEYGADLVMYGDIDGWMSIEDAMEFAEEHAEDEPFINDTDNIPEAFNINEYSPVISTLKQLQQFIDSGADVDILEGIMDSGYNSLEAALDKYEDGDYIWYPGVSTDEELAHAIIDGLGGIKYAVSDISDYIDENQMKEEYEWDARYGLREEAEEFVRDQHEGQDKDEYDFDQEVEDYINENIDDYVQELVDLDIRLAQAGELDLSSYFDYGQFGRDESFNGYVFTGKGAILCEGYRPRGRKKLSEKLYKNRRIKESVNYYDGEVKISEKQRKQLNKICYKYCGWKLPQEIRPLWSELSEFGVDDITIEGYPDQIAYDGGKSWVVSFSMNNQLVTNSRFIYQVYEGQNSLKNEYNIYFS